MDVIVGAIGAIAMVFLVYLTVILFRGDEK